VYFLIIAMVSLVALSAIRHGMNHQRRWETGVGAGLLVFAMLIFGGASLWGEMLWFHTLGYGDRFWTAFGAQAVCGVVGTLLGCLTVGLLTWPISRQNSASRYWPGTLGAVIGCVWGLGNWAVMLKFWHAVPAGVSDPLFDRDVSFYLFTLPLLETCASLVILLTLISIVAAGASLLRQDRIKSAISNTEGHPASTQEVVASLRDVAPRRLLPLQFAAGGFTLAVAWQFYLGAFDLMYSQYGVVHGPGWTDTHVRLPVYYVLAVLFAVSGVVLMAEAAVRRFQDSARTRRRMVLTGGPLASGIVAWVVGLGLLPALFQWLHVQPNEVSVERPYIEHNIEFTRRAFQLDKIEEQQYPETAEFDSNSVEENREVLSQVRLWDPRALDAVYQQFQEIRLYYEFDDVDIDRYTIDGQYRQVLVSPREMALNNLPRQSQTFVNRRFKYTHGYGLTMAPVSEFTSGGLPELLIKDLPPRTTSSDLDVERPEIYYGELTDTHVVVNTTEEEFDYPSGEHNVYARYAGSGGVELSSLWRKFLFGWKFDGTRLFVSNHPTEESRIMFHRQIHERVRTLAPFLHFDEDAYVVLDDGHLYWVIDGYTTSERYPYSEPFQSETLPVRTRGRRTEADRPASAWYLHNANYVRNSVKAVIDAYDGSVDLFVFEPDDPVIQVWEKIFPGLLKDRDEMPASLQKHVRYPEGLLLAQSLVFSRYHMTDPEVFYNQEDVWVRATEKYYSSVQPVEPYYVMWQPPDSDAVNGGPSSGKASRKVSNPATEERPEFILMQPFTPRNRQVLIGWIAGMCDGEDYGRLLAYRFPKEKRVLGTQQVETKIDQDPQLSQQLSLWDQRGSRVVRGNVLAIPVNDTLLYVEPIYLQAEAAAYPELRLVAVMHDDELSYATTFEDALQGLVEGQKVSPALDSALSGLRSADRSMAEHVRRAGRAFDDYLQSLADRDFDAASRELKMLSTTLEAMQELVPEEAGKPASSSAAKAEPSPGPNDGEGQHENPPETAAIVR